MARNRIEDAGAMQVADALKNLKNLKELHIYQNFIRNEGMFEVFASLQGCQNLEFVDVQDNYVKEQTASNLANLVKSNKNLKNLNLSDCNMTEEENEVLLDALEEANLALEKVGFNYNSLSSEQAKRFLNILLQNKSIKRLDIKGNDFRSKTKKYYKEKIEEAGLSEDILSKFESDSEDEDELTK